MTEPIEPELTVQEWRGNWLSYLQLQIGASCEQVVVHPNLIFDFDNSGNLLGIEVLGPVNLGSDERGRLAEVTE